jgi:ANTAR domain
MTSGKPAATPGAEPEARAAGLTGPIFALGEDAVVRRTRDGWRVGGEDVPDLTCAMVLADLLAAELPPDGQPAPVAAARADGAVPAAAEPAGPARPARPQEAAKDAGIQAGAADTAAAADAESAIVSEARRLKATVSQLQYALTARVRVEQAIGVLAERHRIQPRQAFEQLRAAARARGQKVIDIAADVVASATNPLLQLPDELSRPRSARRRSVGQPHGAA